MRAKIPFDVPKQCRVCKREFTLKDVHSWGASRQLFGLSAVRLRVTEHRLAKVCCCGQIHLGEFAAHVLASVQNGPNLRALATKLSIVQRLPSAQVAGLLNELYGTSFSKRGQEARQSKAFLWKDFRGVAAHDCWSAYFDEGRVCHSLCGAHLLRELAVLQEQGSTWAAGIHEFLLGLHENSRRAPPATSILREYRHLLEQAGAAEPQPWKPPSKRGRPKATKGRNLLRRLQQHEAVVLRFALEEGVPFTNNQAECDLHPLKVKQKISGGWRSREGAKNYTALQSLLYTWRKRGKDVLRCLRELFTQAPALFNAS